MRDRIRVSLTVHKKALMSHPAWIQKCMRSNWNLCWYFLLFNIITSTLYLKDTRGAVTQVRELLHIYKTQWRTLQRGSAKQQSLLSWMRPKRNRTQKTGHYKHWTMLVYQEREGSWTVFAPNVTCGNNSVVLACAALCIATATHLPSATDSVTVLNSTHARWWISCLTLFSYRFLCISTTWI